MEDQSVEYLKAQMKCIKRLNLILNLLLIDLGLLSTEVCMQGLHSISAVFKL